MKRHVRITVFYSFLIGLLGFQVGCGKDSKEESSYTLQMEFNCSDTVSSIYADPGSISAATGSILRCAQDTALSAESLQARALEIGYQGPALQSGAQVYRALFVTERANGSPGASSALVYVPDRPAFEQVPVVVAAHGSRGQAAKCAPSQDDPAGEYVKSDFDALVLPLVGAGYAVIAPDLPGYANFGGQDNPPSGYLVADDSGKCTLDAVSAMRRLLGDQVSSQVFLAGHSQGGHSVLSALSMAESYGVDGDLAGVIAYSPLWLSQASWSALLLAYADTPMQYFYKLAGVSIFYHYTVGEIMDGPGHGVDVFAEAVRDQIKNFVENTCWSAAYPSLDELGTYLPDLFDPAYIGAVAPVAVGMAACNDNALCEKWTAQFAQDRPHLTGSATEVPLLVLYGLSDPTITPDRMACVLERLKADQADMQLCISGQADHGGIMRTRADFVNQWISQKIAGGKAPTCADGSSVFFDDKQNLMVQCTTPPPNDSAPYINEEETRHA